MQGVLISCKPPPVPLVPPSTAGHSTQHCWRGAERSILRGVFAMGCSRAAPGSTNPVLSLTSFLCARCHCSLISFLLFSCSRRLIESGCSREKRPHTGLSCSSLGKRLFREKCRVLVVPSTSQGHGNAPRMRGRPPWC